MKSTSSQDSNGLATKSPVSFFNNRPTKNPGQALTEYALILAVIAIAVIGTVTLFGAEIQEVFQSLIDSFDATGSEEA